MLVKTFQEIKNWLYLPGYRRLLRGFGIVHEVKKKKNATVFIKYL
jgi:hypothetical protein